MQITFFVCLINVVEYIRVFYGYAFIRSFIAFTGYYIALVSNADNYINAVVCEDYRCGSDLSPVPLDPVATVNRFHVIDSWSSVPVRLQAAFFTSASRSLGDIFPV